MRHRKGHNKVEEEAVSDVALTGVAKTKEDAPNRRQELWQIADMERNGFLLVAQRFFISFRKIPTLCIFG